MLGSVLERMLHLKPHQLRGLDRLLGLQDGTLESTVNVLTPVIAQGAATAIDNKVPVVGTVDGLADVVTGNIPQVTATPASALTPPTPIVATPNPSPARPITLTVPQVGDTSNPATEPGF
jgi:hypothetical protein